MQSFTPRIEISLLKIRNNTRLLTELYGRKNISLMGVTKAVLGEPSIVKAMIEGGIKFVADSRIENIQKMRTSGISTRFVLLRTPLNRVESIIKYADISLNTEIETLKALSCHAKLQNKVHQVILVVEMGDLREGILPCDLPQIIKETLALPKIKIVGIGCNLACHGGIKPNDKNMAELSKIITSIEKEFQLTLEIISGGNSANYDWYKSNCSVGRINNLRLGESIFLGRETVNRNKIPGMHTEAFKLVAEVIESKEKPSLPFGERCQDAFGNIPKFLDRGVRRRVIVALGKQDTEISGLNSDNNQQILGASSDHIILDSENHVLNVGDEVKFNLRYGSLLAAMTSPFVKKQFVN